MIYRAGDHRATDYSVGATIGRPLYPLPLNMGIYRVEALFFGSCTFLDAQCAPLQTIGIILWSPADKYPFV